MPHLDLNCDIGEIDGDAGRQLDSELLRWITSANIACGAHAGSEERMRQLAIECRENCVAFGAHPGYPDREGFGRRIIPMSLQELRDTFSSQVELAMRISQQEGVELFHVKPHGALYNLAAIDFDVATVIAKSVRDVSGQLRLTGLSGSQLIIAGKAEGLATFSEAFADRQYHANGTLVSRLHADAVIHNPDLIADRVLQMLRTGAITSLEGEQVPLHVETICIHGDTSGAIDIARTIRQRLQDETTEL